MTRHMKNTSLFLSVLCISCATTLPGMAREEVNSSPPKEYRDLMACLVLLDSSARLACYDRHAANLDAATQSHNVVITDREAVKSARRGLFGFGAPVGRLLGLGSNDEDEIRQIESTVARVSPMRDGGWRLTLEDGSSWEQNDTRNFVLTPKIGNAVKITRGSLGTFLVAVNEQRAIKMRRIQ